MGSRSANSETSTRDSLSPDWRRIAAFFEVLKEGVICADREGTVRLANQSAGLLLSRDRSEMPGQSLFDILPSGVGQAVSEAMIGQAREPLTFRGDLHGRTLQVSLSWLPDGDEGGDLLILTLTDETEKRQLEELYHSLEEKLLREHKLSDIGILASGIAHNLNGPLSIIVGYLDLLYSRASDLEEIPIILTQTERMKEIISNMMIKSRHEQDERGRMLNLNTLLKNELKFLDANLNFKHNIDKQYEFA
jgi:signal transduction histidine kinase